MRQVEIPTMKPQLRLLSDDQIRERLKETGAFIHGFDGACVPPHLVSSDLTTAPERIVPSNRKGERALFLEEGKTYYGTRSDTLFTIDTKRRRSKTIERRMGKERCSKFYWEAESEMALSFLNDSRWIRRRRGMP